jgi:competence protein ComFB
MAIKNLMEEIVRNVVSEILKSDDDIIWESDQIDDIVAYVCNRVPPRYVTSERGILHGKLENRLKTQQKTDIFLLTYEAIEVFKNRRDGSSQDAKDSADYSMRRFPHIIGEVLEESTFSVVSGIQITLLYEDKPLDMVDNDWSNPYVTNRATMGYFHFWPVLDSSMKKRENYNFELKFEHPQMKDKIVEFEVDPHSCAGLGLSCIVPVVLMQVKEGVDLEALISG